MVLADRLVESGDRQFGAGNVWRRGLVDRGLSEGQARGFGLILDHQGRMQRGGNLVSGREKQNTASGQQRARGKNGCSVFKEIRV